MKGREEEDGGERVGVEGRKSAHASSARCTTARDAAEQKGRTVGLHGVDKRSDKALALGRLHPAVREQGCRSAGSSSNTTQSQSGALRACTYTFARSSGSADEEEHVSDCRSNRVARGEER